MSRAGGHALPITAAIGVGIGWLIVIPALVIGALGITIQSGTGIGVTVALAARCGAGAPPGGDTQPVGDRTWTGEQLTNAQTIVTVAVGRALPRRAAVLAVATAIVESQLRNLPSGDRDSLGLFQQRPSQGWGRAEDILNPAYAAATFYDHLIALPGWHTMPPGQAEQSIQRSAFPDRYAPQERPAAALVERFWHGPDNPAPPQPGPAPIGQVDLPPGGCPDGGGSNLPADLRQLPPDFHLPPDPQLAAVVSYALAQLGKPYAWGATGPQSFDCSGLTQAAWAHAGIGISRTTSTQIQDGRPVGSLTAVQPGDLLFIPGSRGTPAKPAHVGLSIGYGLVVDAYDEHHGVLLQSLDSWAPQVVAIRRIAPHDSGMPPHHAPEIRP